MEFLIAFLCLCTIFVPVALGVGITFLAERQLGRLAYVVGGLVPIIIILILYAAYDVALRVTPCAPADSLACGQPLGIAFLFSLGFICITVIASALAQAAVFFFLNGRRHAQQQAYNQEYMQTDDQGYYRQDMQGYGQTDEQGYTEYGQTGAQGYYQQDTSPYTESGTPGYAAPDAQAYAQTQHHEFAEPDPSQNMPPPGPDDSESDDLRRYMPPENRG